MFSNVIVDELDSNLDDLTKTINLFCERGSTDKCVVVKTTITNQDNYIPVKTANIQVLLQRYGVYYCNHYYKLIDPIIRSLGGSYSYINEEDETETYDIKSVLTTGVTPFRSNEDELMSFSFNYSINYI